MTMAAGEAPSSTLPPVDEALTSRLREQLQRRQNTKARGGESTTSAEEIGQALEEITEILRVSGQVRDVVKDRMQQQFVVYEQTQREIDRELVDLPQNLDLYLKLIQDRRNLDRRKQQLAKESAGVSHTLNFHLGATRAEDPVLLSALGLGPDGAPEAGAAPSQAQLLAGAGLVPDPLQQQRQAEEEAAARRADEEDARRRAFDEAAREAAVFDEEPDIFDKYTARQGIFDHLTCSRSEEASLEEQCARAEGVAQVELQLRLDALRARNADQVAALMHEYAPERVPRHKEEDVVELGLELMSPAEIIAEGEREGSGRERPTQSAKERDQKRRVLHKKSQQLSRSRVMQEVGSLAAASMHERASRSATLESKSLAMPGVHVSAEMEGKVMGDGTNSDVLRDLPEYHVEDEDGQRIVDPGMRRTVMDNTEAQDLGFPNLEFFRRKDQDDAGYFMPGYKPKTYSAKQDMGGFWSSSRQHARDVASANRSPGGQSGGGGGPAKPKRKGKRKTKKRKAKAAKAAPVTAQYDIAGGITGGSEEEYSADEAPGVGSGDALV